METIGRKFKLVKQTESSDQILMGFYGSAYETEVDKARVFEENKQWIKDVKSLLVKPVCIEEIFHPVATDYSHYCRSLIPNDEWKRVMSSDASAEIDANSLMCGGGGMTYYNLSRMIPKHWTVIDFGASYGAQSYFFTEHDRYVAVEPYFDVSNDWHAEHFKAEGTYRENMTAGRFIREKLAEYAPSLDRTFAILNYVPSWFGEDPNKLVRETFSNLFCFYPCVPNENEKEG